MANQKIRNLTKKNRRRKEKKMKSTSRKCSSCGGEMTARGSFGCSGSLRWKCRRCGHSIVEHKICEKPAEITIGQ